MATEIVIDPAVTRSLEWNRRLQLRGRRRCEHRLDRAAVEKHERSRGESPSRLPSGRTALSPAIALSGEMEVTCGAGLFMRNWAMLETNEPVWTLIIVYAADATSPEGIVALSCWLLTKLVATGFTFQITDVEEVKFDPFTVSVKSPPPATTVVGDSDEIAGVGLPLTGGGGNASLVLPFPHPARIIATLESTQNRNRRVLSH